MQVNYLIITGYFCSFDGSASFSGSAFKILSIYSYSEGASSYCAFIDNFYYIDSKHN